ncbi:hypothetical protein N7523_008971 [Penicillium sp. IBT 18751x]|nr:hypothetical protein N7523_008971 [Penicillium sp. IBT 18751x]
MDEANEPQPNIISFETAIHSPNTIYIFSELVTAGDLVSFLRYRGGTIEEREAVFITRQVLLAIEYLHDRDIVHRDIKPDNILITSLGQCGRVVLTDFGCARRVPQPIERMQTITGTYEYCAPEVNSANNAGYSKSIDLYSLGCVTATLLMGFLPTRESHRKFDHNGDEQKGLTKELSQNGIVGYSQNFIKELLVLDEKQRMNVKQALRHQWFESLPGRDELERRYQVAVDQWVPRPRSDPSIVTLADLEAFQNSAGQAYTLYTRPGERLQGYKFFKIDACISHFSITGHSSQVTKVMPPSAQSRVPPSHQQEDVPSVQGGGHACRRVWSPPSASSSLFSSRHGENDHAELIHRTEMVPGYLNAHKNQAIERSLSHPCSIAEVNKDKSQWGSPRSFRATHSKPRFPSNDSLFYMEMKGEPVHRSATPERAASIRHPKILTAVERQRFPQNDAVSSKVRAGFSRSPAPLQTDNILRYPDDNASFFAMGAYQPRHSAPAITSAMKIGSLFRSDAGLVYRPEPSSHIIRGKPQPNKPYTRQRAAEARNAENQIAEDGTADKRESHRYSKRKRRSFGVDEDDLR